MKEIGLHKIVTDIHPLIACILIYLLKLIQKTLGQINHIVKEEFRSQETKVISSWEKELKLISPEIWKKISNNTWKTTSSTFWREYSWKIQLRFFITSVIQAKYSKEVTARRW